MQVFFLPEEGSWDAQEEKPSMAMLKSRLGESQLYFSIKITYKHTQLIKQDDQFIYVCLYKKLVGRWE